MPKVKERTTGFYFKLSPEEWELIEKRMEITGIRNKSAFIRKMCIDGYVIVLDPKDLSEMGKLLRITSNNANQIARGVNSGYGASREDIAVMNNNLTELRTQYGNLLDALTGVSTATPGKTKFIKPPKITDHPEYNTWLEQQPGEEHSAQPPLR